MLHLHADAPYSLVIMQRERGQKYVTKSNDSTNHIYKRLNATLISTLEHISIFVRSDENGQDQNYRN